MTTLRQLKSLIESGGQNHPTRKVFKVLRKQLPHEVKFASHLSSREKEIRGEDPEGNKYEHIKKVLVDHGYVDHGPPGSHREKGLKQHQFEHPGRGNHIAILLHHRGRFRLNLQHGDFD